MKPLRAQCTAVLIRQGGQRTSSYVGPGTADDVPPCLSLPRRKQVLSLGCVSGMSLALWTHQRARRASLPPRSPWPSTPNSSAPAETESVEGRGPIFRGLCSFLVSAPSQYPALYSLQLAGMSRRDSGLLFKPCLLPDPVLQTDCPWCAPSDRLLQL